MDQLIIDRHAQQRNAHLHCTHRVAVFATPTAPIQLIGVFTGLAGLVLIGLPEVTTDGTNAIGVLLVILAVLSYGSLCTSLGLSNASMVLYPLYEVRFL